MTQETAILMATALSIGFIHTVFGPDHYLPFIVMSKAWNWRIPKTLFITFLCGVGHVLSSIVLGFVGIALGISVLKLKNIESTRGELAGWLLLIFGFTYFVWGLRRAILSRKHTHPHPDESGQIHAHSHHHFGGHSHPHIKANAKI